MYRENTNNDVYSENENGDYDDGYVHWLESKLIHSLQQVKNHVVLDGVIRTDCYGCALNWKDKAKKRRCNGCDNFNKYRTVL